MLLIYVLLGLFFLLFALLSLAPFILRSRKPVNKTSATQ